MPSPRDRRRVRQQATEWPTGEVEWPTTWLSTSATTGSNSAVWNIWVANTSGSNTIPCTGSVNHLVWSIWNDQCERLASTTNYMGPRIMPARALTPEEAEHHGIVAEADRQRAAAERQRWDAAQAVLSREREKANERAEQLLVEHLTPAQREQLKANGFFTIEVGGKTYRIDRGRSRNVRLLGADGKVQRTFCAHPSDACPDADTMLAQKLMLEADEPTFLRIANPS